MDRDEKQTKTNNGNCSCVRVVWSIDRRLIFMSTNLEYRERERQRKGEVGDKLAGSCERQKTKETNFVGKITRKFCCRGEKMGNASGQQGKNVFLQ